MKPIERLELFLKSEGITITACEEKCGFSLGTLRKAISKKTDLKTDSIIKIIEGYPKLDTDWFLMGKGIMIKSVNLSNILEDFIEQFINQKYGETIKGFEQKIEALEDELKFKSFMADQLDEELIKEIKFLLKTYKKK